MAAMGRWRERRVQGQLVALGLLGPQSTALSPDDEERYCMVLATVLEELDEGLVAADKLGLTALLDASTRVLCAAGHPEPPAPRSRMHTLALHLADLQCARASAGTTTVADADAEEGESVVDDEAADTRLAFALHCAHTALGAKHPTAIDASEAVSSLTALLRHRPTHPTAPRALLHDLQPLNGAQREAVDDLSTALAAEYRVRRELLMQRLSVTARSFAAAGVRSAAASTPRALRAAAQVERAAPRAPAYGLPHALAATQHLLAPPRPRAHSARAAKVRQVLMGAVPDRGGRVAAGAKAAAALAMPAFQPRSGYSDAPEARAERKQRRERGARKRGKRGGKSRNKAAMLDGAS